MPVAAGEVGRPRTRASQGVGASGVKRGCGAGSPSGPVEPPPQLERPRKRMLATKWVPIGMIPASAVGADCGDRTPFDVEMGEATNTVIRCQGLKVTFSARLLEGAPAGAVDAGPMVSAPECGSGPRAADDAGLHDLEAVFVARLRDNGRLHKLWAGLADRTDHSFGGRA